VFFEEVIRENLDIGRPSQVRLIFDRRVNKTTPGRFRTRVITDGVIPSLHVDYKNTRIKQYHKQGIARPAEVDGQRASALRFGDKRVQALFTVLAVFSLQLRGFTNSEMRVLLAQLLGFDPADYSVGKLTYDLRRLRLHGSIERIPHSHRYHLTSDVLRIALFFSRTYNRPPFAPVYASDDASRRPPQDSGSGWIRFLLSYRLFHPQQHAGLNPALPGTFRSPC